MRFLKFIILLFSLFFGVHLLANANEHTHCVSFNDCNKQTVEKKSAENKNTFIIEETDLEEDSVHCNDLKKAVLNNTNSLKFNAFTNVWSLSCCKLNSQNYRNYFKNFLAYTNSTPIYIVIRVLKI